jgi:2-polyprenyl-3-methyl-5-hydroxy-6-metoxy-1,4-benzoquinol methylase
MADIDFVHEQYESEYYYTMIHKTKVEIEYEWGFRWRHILSRIAELSDFSSLLDVGAGNGYFVDLAFREYGMKSTGLEISTEEIEFAKNIVGVDLINESIIDHKLNYDVVTCFNVIEHVPDPQALLTCLVDRMQPDGILVISTPNPACIHARVKGIENWDMVAPPHHINLFTRASLDEMVGVRNLEIVKYETLSTYINFARRYDTKDLILRRLFFNALRILGLGADHFFILRKRK